MAAGLKVWRASQRTGALRMGSLKTAVLSGVMTGPSVGRVKGPICQREGLAAPRVARRSRALLILRTFLIVGSWWLRVIVQSIYLNWRFDDSQRGGRGKIVAS